MLFGLGVSPSAAPGYDPVAYGRRAEELGFDFLSTSDHPAGTEPTFECWTMLSWIAAATTRIRLATRVLGLPYRAPAMVAKMAETFDRLSDGRLILGLGGGSSDHEFRAFGLGVPSPGDKVDGLAESIQIITGLWRAPALTFEGRLFHTDSADLTPKPGHRIPIWLGTFGDRALAVTGRLADGWFPSFGHAPPERVPLLRNKIFTAALEAGRDPDTLTCAYHVPVRVGELPDPGVVSGAPEQVAAHLREFTRLGFTALNLAPQGEDLAEQVEKLAAEVIPAVA
jgi:alkanesulfonate monooxygenase SsuD/methylene tetrahydromethanopterin reductase-like flavin-dependent oxidoreductase (luciferase family)